MVKIYIYRTITLLLIVLITTLSIQRSCYRKSQPVVTEIEQIESELQESPELQSIVVTHKPDKVTVTTKEDTAVTTKEYDIPRESDYTIKSDTTGKVRLTYKKWGTCAKPMLTVNANLFGLNVGIGLRWLYLGTKWGLYSGVALYPYFGLEGGVSYRLGQTNCDLHGGVLWNGREITGTIGFGIYLF